MIILLYFIKFSNWVDSSLMVKDLCCQQNTADSASGKVQSDQERLPTPWAQTMSFSMEFLLKRRQLRLFQRLLINLYTIKYASQRYIHIKWLKTLNQGQKEQSGPVMEQISTALLQPSYWTNSHYDTTIYINSLTWSIKSLIFDYSATLFSQPCCYLVPISLLWQQEAANLIV